MTSLPCRWRVTVSNASKSADAWFTSIRDAEYFFGGMRYATKVQRTTIHEVVDGVFSIRAAFENPTHVGADVSDVLLPCFREKELVLTR